MSFPEPSKLLPSLRRLDSNTDSATRSYTPGSKPLSFSSSSSLTGLSSNRHHTNPMLNAPRRMLKTNKQLRTQTPVNSLPPPTVSASAPRYSHVRAQADDILRALNTRSITTTICSPTSSPPSKALKRAYSISSAAKAHSLVPASSSFSSATAAYSIYDDKLDDLLSQDYLDPKKRRKVTFDDRVSLFESVSSNPSFLDQQPHVKKTNSLLEKETSSYSNNENARNIKGTLGIHDIHNIQKIKPSQNDEGSRYLHSRSANTYSRQHMHEESTGSYFDELLKRQELLFSTKIDALERKLRLQAQQIESLKQENKRIQDALRF